MKKILLLALIGLSFSLKAQVVNSQVRAYLSPNFLDVQVWNASPYNANCRGFITAVNMQSNRYMQFFYNQFVWSGSVGYQNYYLGPYSSGMRMRLLNHNIQCFVQL